MEATGWLLWVDETLFYKDDTTNGDIIEYYNHPQAVEDPPFKSEFGDMSKGYATMQVLLKLGYKFI